MIDTTVWSLALRRKRVNLNSTEVAITETVFAMIASGQARILGMIRQELLSGLREITEFDRLRSYLRLFEEPHLEIADYEEGARMFNRCQARGISPTAIDLLICAVAHRRGWRIFTLDHDFEHYRRILGIALYEMP